jgi:hypothetical protein
VLGPDEWLQRRNAGAALQSLRYAWTLQNGKVIDPTCLSGTLLNPLPGWPLGLGSPIDTSLAAINHAPPSLGANVLTKEVGDTVLLVAARDIIGGEELLLAQAKPIPRDQSGLILFEEDNGAKIEER